MQQVNDAIIPRQQVMEFAEQMELKLLGNDHKLNWRQLSDKSLLEGISAEFEELKTAILHGSPEEVIRECADLANYAMFIADKRGRWGEVGR